MASANINIFKEYLRSSDEIINYYNDYAKVDINEYIDQCDDITALDGYYEEINYEVEKIREFRSNLKIILKAISLAKEKPKYELIIEEIEYISKEYQQQKDIIKPYIKEFNEYNRS